ncbi:MAG: hypothetical protein HBSAPP03_01270 [Phycisphaerae bacterium]|nr:MAG: hypothetical protein HBSAPP03_01270 [Phycisphaerae bacterium]
MLTMAESTLQPESTPTPRVIARLPMLIGAFACACLVGSAGGFFAAGLLRAPEGALGPSISTTMGVLPVALGCLVSVLILLPGGVRTVGKLGPAVVLSGTARLLFSLAGGTVLFLLMKPDTAAFFAAMLTAAILCLAVEAAWGTLALRAALSGSERT